jgi:hypothetical protein
VLPGGRAAPARSVLLDGIHEGQRQLVGGRPDQHLVQHDVVEHLQARPAQVRGHGLGVVAGPHDQVGHARAAERAEHGPHLDLPGPLGGRRRVMHGLEAGAGRQVTGDRRETPAQILRPPDQGDAAVVGHVEPLVRVGGPRVCALKAGGQVGPARVGQGPQSEGAVDVHPRTPLPGPRHDVREGIERARVHLPGLSAYHRRSRHVRRETRGPHPPLVVGRDAADSLSPQPDQSQGPDQRGVGVLPDDHGQLRRPEQPVRLHVPASLRQLPVPGRREGGGIGHGCPGHEHRGAAGRKAEELGQPPGHHLVQARGDR